MMSETRRGGVRVLTTVYTHAAQPCGFKLHGHLSVEQELTKIKKTAEEALTTLSARVSDIKPPNIAVASCNVLGLFGGRLTQKTINEPNTIDGGRTDE